MVCDECEESLFDFYVLKNSFLLYFLCKPAVLKIVGYSFALPFCYPL